MEINDRYDGTDDPFQGDRVLRLATIPTGARIRRATATITPKSAPAAAEIFTELIEFAPASTISKQWGATKSRAGDLWVEVDFHARRTLASVSGANFFLGTQRTTLQVDFGGAYVEINRAGGIKTPSDPGPFELTSNTNQPLPGLTVNKFKITNPASGSGPDVTSVTIRSVPANISLRFGEAPSFWTRVGEMTQAETSPDFTLALQAFLADAEPKNGFYNVPLIVHSDSIARLQIDLDVLFEVQEDALSGLNSVVLPFEFGRAPNVETATLQLNLPMNARLSPRASHAQVQGTFDETRIVYDPMEKVAGQAGSPVGFVQAVAPIDKVRIAPNSAQAQPVSFDRELSATAIDLLLEVKQTARLQLDLHEDLDGKPGPASLLPKAVEFEVPGPVGLENTAKSAVVSKWISVLLPADFKFKASDTVTLTRYWIVVQSIDGEAQLSVAAANDAPSLFERIGMQRSTEDGLAWRETAAPKVTGPLTAFFRLRRKPDRFEMPIALQIGRGDDAVRVSLERFAPTGAVNLDLDFDDFNQGLNEHLKKRSPICNDAALILNGDFEDWIRVVPLPEPESTDAAFGAAATPKPPDNSTDQPAEWTLTAGSVKRYPPLILSTQVEAEDHFALLGVRIDPASKLGEFSLVQSALSQVTPVIESCTYDFSFEAIASDEDAVAEVFWLGETCTAVAPDPVRVPIRIADKNPDASFTIHLATTFSSSLFSKGLPFPLHRVRVTAPAGAKQAEVRFSVPDGVVAAIDNVALKGATEAVANSDFRLTEGNRLASWVSTSTDAPQKLPTGGLKFENLGSSPVDIMQTVTVKPDQAFTLTVKKGATAPGAPRALPRVEARWIRADGSETGPPVVLELDPASFSALSAAGVSPRDAAQVEIHFLVPPGASQEIESISLSFPTATVIPVTFVAEAPGELIVSDWRIGFEAASVGRPPIPAKGLCAATPPGNQPGETSDDDCFCMCCDSRQPIVNAVAMQTDAATPARVGACASCGDEMISFSGKLEPGAPKLSLHGILDAQPIFISASPPLTSVRGIGPSLAEQLVKRGITSLETLGAALPSQVADVKGISEAKAADFIAQARKLIG